MDPERWQQIEQLYHSALKHEPISGLPSSSKPVREMKRCAGKWNRC